jgi:hypothetical protein
MGFRSREVGLDSEEKSVSKGLDLMRGTLRGTARRFWARLLVCAFTLVFEFMIIRPIRDLSSTGNTCEFAKLDDLDDLGGLNFLL